MGVYARYASAGAFNYPQVSDGRGFAIWKPSTRSARRVNPRHMTRHSPSGLPLEGKID